MRSSNIIRPHDEEFKKVLEFEPQKVGMGIPHAAKTFMGEQPPPLVEPFKLDELISHQTGVYESEKQRYEQKVDDKAIEKLQEIQEKAYKEAYELGLEEGRKRAFDSNQDIISTQLKDLENLSLSIQRMKKEILEKNESVLIDLVYYISEKVVHEHIEKKPDAIQSLIKEIVSELDSKENMLVKINPDDLKIVNDLIAQAVPGMDFLQKMKFVPTPEIQKGGCIVETDHGLVEATLEVRFKKLWDILNEAKPQ